MASNNEFCNTFCHVHLFCIEGKIHLVLIQGYKMYLKLQLLRFHAFYKLYRRQVSEYLEWLQWWSRLHKFCKCSLESMWTGTRGKSWVRKISHFQKNWPQACMHVITCFSFTDEGGPCHRIRRNLYLSIGMYVSYLVLFLHFFY